MNSESFNCEWIHLPVVDSTNTYLKNHPELWKKEFLTVHAEEQTAGRGRHSRIWHSRKDDLTFSFLFHPPVKTNYSVFTLLVGLCLYEIISDQNKKYGLKNLELKWPNDLLCNNKKIAGILTELVFLENQPILIIGIGINVNSEVFSPDILQPATSMKIELGLEINKMELLNDIQQVLARTLPHVVIPLPPKKRKEWLAASHAIGKKISHTLPDGSVQQRTIVDLSELGELIVTDDFGEKIIISSGEIQYQS